MNLGELWARVWPLILIFLVTIGGWFLLANLSLHSHAKDQVKITKGPESADYDKAKTWATDLLGLAGAFAGFLGIAAASQRLGLSSTDREQSGEGGLFGVLAGATLLGVGGWPVPFALAALATGVATARVVRALRK
jgi:hypothetical protein